MNELKPCPFCGDRGEVFVYYSCFDGSKWGVRCFSCGISQRVKHRSRAEAIEAWNMRDSESVRHGYWVAYEDNKRECYCSNCEFPAGLDAYGYHNMQDPYCRFCGAKMDGKENNNE